MTDPLLVEGRAWVFGDEVNTDDMYPGFAMRLPVAEAARHMFDASRPDWPGLVEPGDIVVGGRNFGLGSSRPVALLFRELGVGALVAERFNTLFLRNCVNYGLPALTVPGIAGAVREGDRLRVDVRAGELTDLATGTTHAGTPLPDFLADIIQAGGLIPRLEASGHLRPTL
ncbi:MAG: 3-isopropylmalate dehydratase [Streptosporangiales bacterium]|nr:3-isopropylmalate dehydratase [Streptosporangiales bacterium]